MSTNVPERGRITDTLIEYVKTAQLGGQAILVGDGDPPKEGGWTGSPGTSNFRPSTTVRTLPAVGGLFKEGVRTRHTSWRMTYGLRTVAGLRKQADDLADTVRQWMGEWQPADIAGWRIVEVVFESLGEVAARGTQDANRTWEIDDVVHLWVVRAVT